MATAALRRTTLTTTGHSMLSGCVLFATASDIENRMPDRPLVDGEHVADIKDESYNGLSWYVLIVDGKRIMARKTQAPLAGSVGYIVSNRRLP